MGSVHCWQTFQVSLHMDANWAIPSPATDEIRSWTIDFRFSGLGIGFMKLHLVLWLLSDVEQRTMSRRPLWWRSADMWCSFEANPSPASGEIRSWMLYLGVFNICSTFPNKTQLFSDKESTPGVRVVWKWKSTHSHFQNTKNYWNRSITRDEIFILVMESIHFAWSSVNWTLLVVFTFRM